MTRQALTEAPSRSATPAASAPIPAIPRSLYLLIGISGMSGLMYEIVWIRALGLHFGTSTPAVTTVVATFMAGLGLGNGLLGRYADRIVKPLTLYRRIEFSIAATGLVVSMIVLRAGSWIDWLSRWCSGLGLWALPGSALALAMLMGIPCTLMGGTLPVMSRAFVRDGHSGRAVGALYVSNTVGALMGALLPDFVFISHFGLTVTVLIAAAGNAFVALSVGRVVPKRVDRVAAPRPIESEGPIGRVPPAAWLLTAVSGLSGMALEVLWSRTLSFWTVGLVTSFAVLLAVYLSMLALGAALTRHWADRSRQPLQMAALLLSLAGLAALVPIVLAPKWHSWQHGFFPPPVAPARPGLLHLAAEALMHAAYLEVGACLLMGAAFPFVAAAIVRQGAAGTGTGRLFTVNTLAGTLGALLAGFVGLPAIGEQTSYLAAASVLVFSGFLVLLPRPIELRGPRVCAFASLILAIGIAALLPKDHLARTHFGSRVKITALREGGTTTAAVSRHLAYGQVHYLELLTPNVAMSNTSFVSRRYMGMMAHAAMLTARTPERALLICYGTGNTASSLLSYPALRRLDVVDISREVLDLAPMFAQVRGSDPLADSRTHVFVEDGRHHLVVHDAPYDVITLEPPPPNHSGVVNLYSREFYRLARNRLSRGGVISQWLPVWQLSKADILAMVSAFVSELPHAALLYGMNRHFILIGSREPLAIDPREGTRRASEPSTAANLRNCGIAGLPDICGAVLQTDSELRSMVRNVPPLNDDRPSIQYPWQGIARLPNYAVWFGHNPARAGALLSGRPDAPQQRAITAVASANEQVLAIMHLLEDGSAARQELVVGNAVRRALALRPNDEALLGVLSLQSDRIQLAERVLNRPGASSLLDKAAPEPDSGKQLAEYQLLRDATLTLARRAFYKGEYRTAFALLSKVSPKPAEGVGHALLAGGCLRGLGRIPEARAAFERAARLSRDRVFQAVVNRLAHHAAEPVRAEMGPLIAAGGVAGGDPSLPARVCTASQACAPPL